MAEIKPPNWEQNFPLRFHEAGGKSSWALYSPCENYRYRLRRKWAEGKSLSYIMLNPSTADEKQNDPTVERCERRARALGFAAFEVVNIFAYRSTNPKNLYQTKNPIGRENDRAIMESVQSCDQTLLAWGAHGKLHNRSQQIRELLKNQSAWHLGLTKEGEPRHPLYISYSKAPEMIEL